METLQFPSLLDFQVPWQKNAELFTCETTGSTIYFDSARNNTASTFPLTLDPNNFSDVSAHEAVQPKNQWLLFSNR